MTISQRIAAPKEVSPAQRQKILRHLYFFAKKNSNFSIYLTVMPCDGFSTVASLGKVGLSASLTYLQELEVNKQTGLPFHCLELREHRNPHNGNLRKSWRRGRIEFKSDGFHPLFNYGYSPELIYLCKQLNNYICVDIPLTTLKLRHKKFFQRYEKVKKLYKQSPLAISEKAAPLRYLDEPFFLRFFRLFKKRKQSGKYSLENLTQLLIYVEKAIKGDPTILYKSRELTEYILKFLRVTSYQLDNFIIEIKSPLLLKETKPHLQWVVLKRDSKPNKLFPADLLLLDEKTNKLFERCVLKKENGEVLGTIELEENYYFINYIGKIEDINPEIWEFCQEFSKILDKPYLKNGIEREINFITTSDIITFLVENPRYKTITDGIYLIVDKISNHNSDYENLFSKNLNQIKAWKGEYKYPFNTIQRLASEVLSNLEELIKLQIADSIEYNRFAKTIIQFCKKNPPYNVEIVGAHYFEKEQFDLEKITLHQDSSLNEYDLYRLSPIKKEKRPPFERLVFKKNQDAALVSLQFEKGSFSINYSQDFEHTDSDSAYFSSNLLDLSKELENLLNEFNVSSLDNTVAKEVAFIKESKSLLALINKFKANSEHSPMIRRLHLDSLNQQVEKLQGRLVHLINDSAYYEVAKFLKPAKLLFTGKITLAQYENFIKKIEKSSLGKLGPVGYMMFLLGSLVFATSIVLGVGGTPGLITAAIGGSIFVKSKYFPKKELSTEDEFDNSSVFKLS